MAVAGSVVHAYRCWVEDGKLRMIPTSILRGAGMAPDYAVLSFRRAAWQLWQAETLTPCECR